jgi:hypothetical protein
VTKTGLITPGTYGPLGVKGECYLEAHDWWIPIIMIILVTCPWAESQDHQQDNQCTFYSF